MGTWQSLDPMSLGRIRLMFNHPVLQGAKVTTSMLPALDHDNILVHAPWARLSKWKL